VLEIDYRLISFSKENIVDGDLIREHADEIPVRGTYTEWLRRVQGFEIPGTFGFVFKKLRVKNYRCRIAKYGVA
jgi:hypothetical protein